MDYSGSETFLCRSSYGFDASVTEIFVPLTIGGNLVLVEEGRERDPDSLLSAIRDHEVNVVETVPSGLRMMVDRPMFSECTSLQKVVLGGEALSEELTRAFYERCSATLHNPYGPTEATVETTMVECGAEGPVSIGAPMHGYQVLILDETWERRPPRYPGELCIAGRGLALGYHGRARRTATSFVPNPHGDAPGARMYRSGDVARWQDDGTLLYVGRLDHQIQIRGVRIELSEIEAALKSLPGIGQAVVIPRNESDGRADDLVAYVVVGNRA
jgi:non-ribosomal peptide synthetase component F